ncbi:LysR substrate-binding domain-containing protein [Tianweitania sediminis]|uniref:LysR substrate-binding domain-containing protein n=1 Tax=Tianweitania sediminis TaxID=1502156 RepID=UPI00315995A9
MAADEVDTNGVDAQPFAEIHATLAIPPGHPPAEKVVVHPADLDKLPFVALAPEDTTRHEAEAIFHKYGVAPQVVVETAYSSTICAMVLAGLGCGIVDPVTAIGFTDRGLVLRPFAPSVSFRTLMLFPNQKRSRIVKEMADALHKERTLLSQSHDMASGST